MPSVPRAGASAQPHSPALRADLGGSRVAAQPQLRGKLGEPLSRRCLVLVLCPPQPWWPRGAGDPLLSPAGFLSPGLSCHRHLRNLSSCAKSPEVRKSDCLWMCKYTVQEAGTTEWGQPADAAGFGFQLAAGGLRGPRGHWWGGGSPAPQASQPHLQSHAGRPDQTQLPGPSAVG